MTKPKLPSQAGAALLTAMLTVALVATFAASALWQQWRSIEVESAERARVQSSWVLTGALDWARLVLREDGKSGGADHLGEPWAVPLQEARLSSFLAADRSNTADVGPEVLEAFLSGQIIDLQSMLNVSRLVQNGQRSQDDYAAFARLFELLGLPPAELDRLADNLRLATDTAASVPNPMAPLEPKSVEQLVWLGLSPQTAAALQPYVVVLPAGNTTTVNLNTASAEVIYASIPGLSLAEAQHLVAERERAHFKGVAAASMLLSGGAARIPAGQFHVGTSSRFFEVRARLRLDQLVVEERALVERNGATAKIVRRERGAGDPTALSQAAVKR